MKFSTKLTLIFSSMFLIMGAVISYSVYTSNIKVLEAQINDRQMNDAIHTMDKIDRMLYERFVNIKMLAADPVISSRGSTPAQISERLQAFQAAYKMYASLSFFDMNRVRIADTSGEKIGEQRKFVEYWIDIAEGKEFVVNLHKSITLHKIVIHFVQVVKDKNGIPFGVVVSRTPVDELNEIVEQVESTHKHGEFKIELLDKNGLILYSSKNKDAILKKESDDWEIIEKSVVSGIKNGALKYTNPKEYIGEEILSFAHESGYREYAGNDWTLVLLTPTSIAFASAMELRSRIIIVMLVCITLTLLFIYFFSNKISHSIEMMSDAAHEISRGNLDVRIKITSKDETGRLAETFNRMTADLSEKENRLIEYSRELEAKVLEQTSELRKTNELLRKNEASLTKAQQIARLGNWESDFATGHVTWSDEMYRIFGLHPDQFKPTFEAFLSYVHPDDRGFVNESVGAAISGNKPYGGDYRIVLPDGSVRDMHTEVELVFDGTGKPVGMRGISQDITDRKKIEDELEKKDKLESIGLLAGGMAHDFNNLLTGILGNISLAKMHMRPDIKAYTLLSEAEKICIKMTELTKKFLTFSKGGSPFRKVLLISTIINETTCSELSGPAISCQCDFSDGLFPVNVDDMQISQVFRNMVINAREAMPEGGLIRVVAENIILDKDDAVLKKGKYVKITIKDSGKGIPDEILPKIFDPYFTTKEMSSVKGMGLGLAVCYSIIKQHDGHITVESKAGEGTAFHIYLPAA